MQEEELKKQSEILINFLQIYCTNKHEAQEQISINESFIYQDATLCQQCKSLLFYALQRLKACPHDPKPKCRKCKNPCYEPKAYKQMAKIMLYSGFKLGLSKIKKATFNK